MGARLLPFFQRPRWVATIAVALQVNGQPWREMRRLAQQVGVGGALVYTVQRGGQLVAFLFQPARSRIQTFVDRAFFRREYEACQTLTAFSRGLSTLRDRDQVVRLVRDTVTETLSASSADLWLLDNGQYRPTQLGSTESLPL